jgi:alpha-ketoglutarate-dependent taurine dioxygenase
MKSLPAVRRAWITSRGEELVRMDLVRDGQPLPLILKPAVSEVNLLGWAASNLVLLESLLLKHGAILFRGFAIKSVNEFEQFISVVSGGAIKYQERSSPRTEVIGNIYTSTDYPADQRIFLHNEQSYNLHFPLKIFFFCVTPPDRGGETPLADTRKVFQRIERRVRERLIAKKYMYVRHFGEGLGLTWQAAFQTQSRAQVETYCREQEIEFEWKDENHLKTRQVRRLAARHPRTGEMVWFNHLTFFHVSTLDPTLQHLLLATFKEEDLPNNTYYGDGTPIEPAVLDHLRCCLSREMATFRWQQADLLLADNMLTAHGRAPFSGARQVVVGMADLCSWHDVQA